VRTFEIIGILNITDESIFDDRIINIDSPVKPIRQYNIRVQWWDKNTHAATGFVHITVRFSLRWRKIYSEKKNDQMPTTFASYIIALFDEIRYELNSVEIDRNRSVDIISMLKNYVTYANIHKVLIALNAGWNSRSNRKKDTLIFACRSACCWAFAKITNAWSSMLANWF